jgi:hypothetical protein
LLANLPSGRVAIAEEVTKVPAQLAAAENRYGKGKLFRTNELTKSTTPAKRRRTKYGTDMARFSY